MKLVQDTLLTVVVVYTGLLWWGTLPSPAWWQQKSLSLTDVHLCLYHVDAEHCDPAQQKLFADTTLMMDAFDTNGSLRVWTSGVVSSASDSLASLYASVAAALEELFA